jgi:putative resolvase
LKGEKMRHISIGEGALSLGVSVVTLRRWDRAGRLRPAFRTFGNHRRYDLSQVENLNKRETSIKKVMGYSRVSSFDQKKDLLTQTAVLSKSLSGTYLNFEIIEDLGSGLNYKKKGLRKLIKLICNQEISAGVKVEILSAEKEESFEQTLCKDVLSIITVFSAKLYGKRSHKNKLFLKNSV